MSLVPGGSLGSQRVLGDLRWLAQKEQLGQDAFLLGPPGPARRRLVMAFLVLPLLPQTSAASGRKSWCT